MGRYSLFLINSFFLGVGLAMDAFSVALVNGLRESRMRIGKMLKIAGVFGGFQVFMPLLGWYFAHGMINCFSHITRYIPGISLVLLLFIGGKMLSEGINSTGTEEDELKGGTLFAQGLATSVDALSVGFTIGGYPLSQALTAAVIIASVTFASCMAGLKIGKKAQEKLSSKVTAAGGIILIILGFELFFTSAV